MPLVNCGWVDFSFFQKKNEKDFLPEDGVEVWYLSVSQNLELIKRFSSVLSDEEAKRATRYFQEKDQVRFILVRIALRLLIGEYIGKKPAEVEISIGTNKKPFLKNIEVHGLHFNISHSKDGILIAFSKQALGVDLEKWNDSFSFKELLPGNFSTDEIEFINQSKNPVESFYLLWTRKEAILKASAKGLEHDLDKVPAMDGQNKVPNFIIGSDSDWNVNSFKMPENYIGSIATPKSVLSIRFLDFKQYLFTKNK